MYKRQPQISAAITIVANLIVLRFLIPAYKIDRHKGILLIIFAYMIGTFDTVLDHTVSIKSMHHNQLLWFYFLRKGTYIANVILSTVGIIYTVRYLIKIRESPANKQSKEAEQPGPAQPATQPADKPSVKDQPSTPTSEDAPR